MHSLTGDIAHARNLIEQGPSAGDYIIIASIEEGGDGVNRNYGRPGAPAWNWSVTEFVTFSFVTVELWDGWPTYVEQNPGSWIENTGRQIGFWGYTVIRELGTVPGVSLEVAKGGGMSLMVSNLRVGDLVRVYEATAVVDGDWREIGQFTATSPSTIWTVPEGNMDQRFYSVSIE